MDVSLSSPFLASNCIPAADSLGSPYPESGKSGMAVWRKTVRNWRGEQGSDKLMPPEVDEMRAAGV